MTTETNTYYQVVVQVPKFVDLDVELPPGLNREQVLSALIENGKIADYQHQDDFTFSHDDLIEFVKEQMSTVAVFDEEMNEV